jgi:hypothetical protein
MGVFTNRLKYDEYVDKSDVSNFRALSLFTFLENVMQSRILRHLTEHNTVSTEQLEQN